MSNGDEALKNKLRRMIYNHIIKYPGVSFNTIKEIYELTDNSLRYHLYYLKKNNKISSALEKGTRRYYAHPKSVTIPPKTQNLIDSQKLNLHQERLLNVIMRYPGINQKELVSRTGMNRYKILRTLDTLKNMNLIKNSRFQNKVCYEYTPDIEMKYRIMKGLMVKFLKGEIDEKTFLKLNRRLGD